MGEVRETIRRPNLQPFLDDPDVWLVASIEDYDVETGVVRPGPIFTERVLHPPVTPEVAAPPTRSRWRCTRPAWWTSTASPSFSASARGGDRGARESRIPRPAGGPPGLRGLADGDAYLSGPVRKKLEIAIDAAFEDPHFERTSRRSRKLSLRT